MNALGQSQYQPQTQTAPQPQPFFGGKADLGGEVKFTVEVVKVRGLTGLYSLEVKRIKGTLSDWRENHVRIEYFCLTPLLRS
jgi:protein-serine/threonine kinase